MMHIPVVAQRRNSKIFRIAGQRKRSCDDPFLADRNIISSGRTSHQEIEPFYDTQPVKIIPGGIHQIPGAILHLYVIPHMRFAGIVSFRFCVSHDQSTGNIKPITQNFEGFRVSLTYYFLPMQKHSCSRMSVRVLLIGDPKADIVMDRHYSLVTVGSRRQDGLYLRHSRIYRPVK